MQNSHRFFNNNQCQYFPCHTSPEPELFNCLFCYCPLYSIDDCGGDYIHINGTIKNCMDCHMPHIPEFYDVVIDKLTQAASTRRHHGTNSN